MIYFLLIASVFGYSAYSDITCNNAYCGSCDEDKKCTTCIKGYLLVDGDCKYMRDEHCNEVEPDDETLCLECLDGYKLNLKTGKCEQGEEKCEEALMSYFSSEDKLECFTHRCKENELETSKGCIDCSANPYCEQLENDASDCTQCKLCAEGTKKVNGKCEVIDNNCSDFSYDMNINTQKFDIEYYCTSCAMGYMFDSNKKCVKGNIEGCAKYGDDGKCQTCINGGVVENGKCTDKCDVEHCLQCVSTDAKQCDTCELGYYANGENKCVPNPANCYVAVEYGGTTMCYQCNEGYWRNQNGECKQFPENCEEVDEDTEKCSTCTDGYYLNEEKNCVACAQDCETCTSANFCESCKDKTKTVSGGKCYTTIEGCYNYNEDGTCIDCDSYNDNYKLTADGKCVKEACAEKSGDKCIECSKGYYMTKDYKCEKCNDKCTNGCIHTANSCISNDYNCFQAKEDGSCSKCKENGYGEYVMVDGVCQYPEDEDEEQIGIACISYTFDMKCTLCADYETFEMSWPDENGQCKQNGAFTTTLLFFVVVLMMLF